MRLKKVTRDAAPLKVRNRLYPPATRNLRVRGLKVHEFTIISNSCWGSTAFESYGLTKQSPTVGVLAMPKDYVCFCSGVERCPSLPLELARPEESKYADALSLDSHWSSYLASRLVDEELEILHHYYEAEARDKRDSHVRRVSGIGLSSSSMTRAVPGDLEAFEALPLGYKVVFAVRGYPEVECCMHIHCSSYSEFIPAWYESYRRDFSFDTSVDINSCIVEG